MNVWWWYTSGWMICKRRCCKNEKFCTVRYNNNTHYCTHAEFEFDVIWIPRDWNVSYFTPNPNSVYLMWETSTGAEDIRRILYGKPKYDTCLELENNVDTYPKKSLDSLKRSTVVHVFAIHLFSQEHISTVLSNGIVKMSFYLQDKK